MTAAIYAVAVVIGQAVGYGAVRLFIWAWPSLWRLGTADGREQMRERVEVIMECVPHHSRWRAWFYAFEGARHYR